jgi:hypothetical protein
MKRYGIPIALVLAVGLYGQSDSERSTQSGRYQLVVTTIPVLDVPAGTRLTQTVFMIDTQQGRVWRYESPIRPSPKAANQNTFPAFLDEVNVDGLRGWDLPKAYRAWQSESSR